MDTIWVYGNNDWSTPFKLKQLELISVFASVTLWKHFYPTAKTILYCDKSVEEYLTKVGIINLWDDVNTNFLTEQGVYNRKVFWTIDKIRLFQHIKTPFTFIDFDFYIKKKLPNYTEYDYVIAFEENTKEYYPYFYDEKFKTLKFPNNFTFNDTAHNTCFFYVSNSDVTKQYTNMCLSYMKEINDVDEIHGGHSVFLEQTILYQLAKVNNWNTKALVNKKFNVLEENWTTESTNGFIDDCKVNDYFTHLSNDKRRLVGDETKAILIKSEIIELTKKFNPHLLPKLFNIIKNESC